MFSRIQIQITIFMKVSKNTRTFKLGLKLDFLNSYQCLIVSFRKTENFKFRVLKGEHEVKGSKTKIFQGLSKKCSLFKGYKDNIFDNLALVILTHFFHFRNTLHSGHPKAILTRCGISMMERFYFIKEEQILVKCQPLVVRRS